MTRWPQTPDNQLSRCAAIVGSGALQVHRGRAGPPSHWPAPRSEAPSCLRPRVRCAMSDALSPPDVQPPFAPQTARAHTDGPQTTRPWRADSPAARSPAASLTPAHPRLTLPAKCPARWGQIERRPRRQTRRPRNETEAAIGRRPNPENSADALHEGLADGKLAQGALVIGGRRGTNPVAREQWPVGVADRGSPKGHQVTATLTQRQASATVHTDPAAIRRTSLAQARTQ